MLGKWPRARLSWPFARAPGHSRVTESRNRTETGGHARTPRSGNLSSGASREPGHWRTYNQHGSGPCDRLAINNFTTAAEGCRQGDPQGSLSREVRLRCRLVLLLSTQGFVSKSTFVSEGRHDYFCAAGCKKRLDATPAKLNSRGEEVVVIPWPRSTDQQNCQTA